MGKPRAKVKKTKSRSIKKIKGLKARKKLSRQKTLKQQTSRVEISIHKNAGENTDSFGVHENGLDDFDCLPDEEDMALVDDQMGESLMFLKGISTKLQTDPKLTDHKKRKRKREDVEQELSFEMQPRQKPKLAGIDGENDELTEIRHLLPIKNATGLVQRTEVRKKQVIDEVSQETDAEMEKENDVVNVENEDVVGVEESCSPLTAAQAVWQRERKLALRKQEIAKCCDAILEDPEGHASHLKRLRSLCEEREPDICITGRKLAMVSLMSVFIDILPGYRIQPTAESQQSVKLSKEVKKLRTYEQSLLQNYQSYLTLLEDTVHASSRANHKAKHILQLNGGTEIPWTAARRLKSVAVNCMCRLLIAHPHFNFRNNLLTVIVPLMNEWSADGKMALCCCDAVSQLFKQDSTGEVSVEALKIITRLIKSKSYRVRREILDTFLDLQVQDVPPVGDTQNGGSSKEQRKVERRQFRRLSQKEKRRRQEKVRLERELREAQAVESKEKRTKMQTESIKLVFSTYFRILKNAQNNKLLSSVLKGLGKFAHLINVDFLTDLTNVLENIASSQGVSAEDSLHCVLAAFRILSGQGEVLTFDPRQFYVCLYRRLLDVDSQESHIVPVVMECLDVLFKKRKQISTQRILAFMKRSCTVSLTASPAAAMGLLAATRSFLQAYPKSEQLLDSDATLTGVFRADIEDPDLSNAGSTTLWEVCLLQHHVDAQLVSYARHVAMGAPSTGKGSLPSDTAKRELCEVVRCVDWRLAFSPIPMLDHLKEEHRLKDKPLLHPERFVIPTSVNQSLLMVV